MVDICNVHAVLYDVIVSIFLRHEYLANEEEFPVPVSNNAACSLIINNVCAS